MPVLLNAAPFEYYEILEAAWRAENGVRRVFYNGLIHGAVAIYRHRCGNAVDAARQWMRACWKLEIVLCKYLQLDCHEFLGYVKEKIAISLIQIEDAEKACWPELRCQTQVRMQCVLDAEN